MNDLEKLRHSFRPHPITALIVGESPPHGGTFFYKENSLLYRSIKECFGDPADFLAKFKANGFFLDDLVLYPINKMAKKERHEHRQKAVSCLTRRMAEYRPAAVVIVMCAIKEMVINAKEEAGLSHVPHYVTPFPTQHHIERFKVEMADILARLPT